MPKAQAAGFESDVQAYQATLKNELAVADPGVTATAVGAGMPAKVRDPNAQQVVIDVLYANPQGVLRMSDTVPGWSRHPPTWGSPTWRTASSRSPT